MKILAIVVISAHLAGCAGMADSMSAFAGVGVVSEETSTFDNARVVTMTPAFIYSGEGMSASRFKLGARWTSTTPDNVSLQLFYEPYLNVDIVGFEGLQVNIDGQVSTFEAGPTNYDTEVISGALTSESSAFVVVPFETLDAMLAAKDCRLRILASNRYEDAVFTVERIPGGQGTAILSLRNFVSTVGR